MGNLHFGGVFFRLYELVDKLHWAGAVEGDKGYDFLENAQAYAAAEVLHALAFKLENADSCAAVEQLESCGIFERNFFDVERRIVARASHVVLSVGNDGESL